MNRKEKEEVTDEKVRRVLWSGIHSEIEIIIYFKLMHQIQYAKDRFIIFQVWLKTNIRCQYEHCNRFFLL